MISPLLPAHDAVTIALDFGVFIAEQARTHRVSQTAIIAALRPHFAPQEINPSASNSGPVSPSTPKKEITPSQPEGSSSPHAPAAQTDGEASPQAAPSVATISEVAP